MPAKKKAAKRPRRQEEVTLPSEVRRRGGRRLPTPLVWDLLLITTCRGFVQQWDEGTLARRARTLLVCLTLALSSVALLPASPAAAAPADDMMNLTNQMRAAIGAPTLAPDARIAAAAQNHANYNAANGISGHFETAGLPYYTGYSARDRVAARGLSTSFVSEVATGGSDGLAGVRQLWDAPYHRLGMMHPSASSMAGCLVARRPWRRRGDITYNFGIRVLCSCAHPRTTRRHPTTGWERISESTSGRCIQARGLPDHGRVLRRAHGRDARRAADRARRRAGADLHRAAAVRVRLQVIIPQRPLAANTTYHVASTSRWSARAHQ